jgi:hypothetical protein
MVLVSIATTAGPTCSTRSRRLGSWDIADGEEGTDVGATLESPETSESTGGVDVGCVFVGESESVATKEHAVTDTASETSGTSNR